MWLGKKARGDDGNVATVPAVCLANRLTVRRVAAVAGAASALAALIAVLIAILIAALVAVLIAILALVRRAAR